MLGRRLYVVAFEADHRRAGRLEMTMVVRAERVPDVGWVARGISAGASVPEPVLETPRVLLGGSWGRFGFCGGGRVCAATPDIVRARLRFGNGIELEDDTEAGWALFFTDVPVERPEAVVELLNEHGEPVATHQWPPARGCRTSCDGASRSCSRGRADGREAGATVSGVNLELLEETLADEPAYRGRQVWEWVARGASSYGEMTNLPAGLRARLESAVPFSSLDVAGESLAKDGTLKTLFHTADRKPVEAVLMRYRDGRRSVCVSSQSGCPLTCTFCATGQMQFGRNLTAGEILDQALHFRRIEPIDHLVFMGMGEPLMNLDAVLEAARRLPEVGVTHRRTTISTVGWLPGLTRFVDEVEEPIRLALSLHAPTDALRSELMPVNDRYPLEDVLAECRRYVALRGRKVYVEYVMLAGVNDSPEQARELARLLDPKAFKVNLIPYNPTGNDYKGHALRGVVAGADRALQGGARPGARARDGATDPRPRHRGRLRPARGDRRGTA